MLSYHLFAFLTLLTPIYACRIHRLIKRASSTDQLDAAKVAAIKNRLAINSTDSWVAGTRTQALLEYDYPDLAVYSTNYTQVFAKQASPPIEVNPIVNYWQNVHNATDGELLTNFGIYSEGNSPTDTYSIGNAFVIASLTEGNATLQSQYADSVKQAIDFIWSPKLLKTDDGIFSTCPDKVQFWADEISMMPPFLAYYGVATNNLSYLQESFRQIEGYRNVLKPNGTTELWHHIRLSTGGDERIWSTGAAWMANGALRVAATMLNSPFSEQLQNQTNTLLHWSSAATRETFYNIDKNASLVPNVYYLPANQTTFPDSSSSALFAATAYRLASLQVVGASDLVPVANAIRHKLYTEVTPDGWIESVVNPLNWGDEEPTNESPESLAFMLMVEAAWRDYGKYCQKTGQSQNVSISVDIHL